MLRKTFALAVVAALTISTMAQAAVVGSATLQKNPPGTPFTAPDAALGAPWRSYSLDIAGNAGEIIAAVNVSLTGQFHQRWVDTDFDTVFEPTNTGGITNGDSHIRAIAGALFGAGPTENNPGSGSPLASTETALYGVGTSISGAWGIPGASQSSNATLAYIVIPDGSQPNVDISVAVADGLGNIIANLTEADFFAPVGGVAPLVADLSHVTTLLNEVVNLQPVDSAPGTPPVTFSALAGPTYTPMFGALPGAPGLGTAPSWNPATQQFSFNTAGSTRGRYVWTGSASNATGSDPFSLTVDVTQVPEPASIALFGLALVGLVGIARRR